MDWLEYRPAFLPQFLSREIDLRMSAEAWASFWMSALLALMCSVGLAIVLLAALGWRDFSSRGVKPDRPVVHKARPVAGVYDDGSLTIFVNKNWIEGRAE